MNNESNKLKCLSLFSGCGGMDLGALGGFVFQEKEYSRLNTSIVFANDIDCDAVTCYNSNSLLVNEENEKAVLGDIRDIPPSSLPDFDILLAGFPCQPFSNAGNRKGVNDNGGRGVLFEVCENVLREKVLNGKTKPKAFVFENVRGILSSKMPNGITVPDEIRNRMEKLGFSVSQQLICASDYGVPQQRYRVLIIGIYNPNNDKRKKFNFSCLEELVKSENIPSSVFGGKEKLVLGSILKDIEIPGEYLEYSKGTQYMIEKIGSCKHGKNGIEFFKNNIPLDEMPTEIFEGRSWKNIPPEMLPPRFKRIYDQPKKYHAPKFYRRFAYGEINGTITASAQPENCGITHPVENRRFSVKEIARIQSFPDSFDFSKIPLQSRYKVIGNAVPPVLSWCIFKTLTDFLQGDK